ncbi:CRISPR-associated helicase Cas3' [Acetomicrobium sp. S15 = DSM 107314]|uniref:CRISPR-associated helicase Cas3' n=1 Tax=Acetomicrobium sp. S15 = DSM 107314 TaxID=2529858 RepID=UPI0018E1415E|nr:CRISPR-associated helicase Cas3' [Acetomicrobium sp. S15 = DSM 107314]
MDELLAKPDMSLLRHSTDVMHLGNDLANRMKLNSRLRLKALLACALHDIGKATIDFQEYIRRKKRKAYPHALASFPLILAAEGMMNNYYRWDSYELTATASVLTHHSPLGPELYRGFEAPGYHPNLKIFLGDLWNLLESYEVNGLPGVEQFLQFTQPLLNKDSSPATILDCVIHAKGQLKYSIRGLLQVLPAHDFAQVKSVLHLADWLASAGKHDASVLFLNSGKQIVKSFTSQFPLRNFQRQAEDSYNDNIQLRAPTGTGKTEALLLWANDAERLIYLLPTQATVNAMWKRLQCIYGDDYVALAHERANYMLRNESDEDPLEMRLFGSVFAKPVTVATLDQYLFAHLNGRHWEERRCFAKQATVVLDEIHAYEPYTLGLLVKALKTDAPARFAIASATLPPSLLKLFPKGTLIEAEHNLWQRTRHRLHLEDDLLQNVLGRALSFATSGKRVLIVVNTIREAQMLYQTLKNELNWDKCHLLHARFTFRDRQEKEEKVKDPKPGTIFIATQIVEVSLDISYDMLLTEIAPIDALVQRMGRVNRSGDQPQTPVIVCCKYSENSKHVYGKEILDYSLEILKELPASPTDQDLANATDRLYSHIMALESWNKEFNEGAQTLEEVQNILGCYTIDLSDENMRDKFITRRGQISVDVIPAAFLQDVYHLYEIGEAWRIVEYLTPVPIWWIYQFSDRFPPCKDIQHPVADLPYNSEIGLLPPYLEEDQDDMSKTHSLKDIFI